GERLQVGADLVADIAGGRGAVGADDAEVHLAVLHEVAADVVGDYRMGHAVAAELPGGQRGALVARPRLVDPDVDRDALLEGHVQGCGRRAPVHRGQPAGI